MPAHSKFDAAMFEAICERISNGEPLAEICRDPAITVTQRTVNRWCKDNPELLAEKLEARDEGHDAIANRLRLTARGKTQADGGESTGDVQRDKLIVDTDLKLLAKWDRRYSDKHSIEHSGPNGGPLQFQRVEIVAVEPE